jgi:hypothetical protein
MQSSPPHTRFPHRSLLEKMMTVRKIPAVLSLGAVAVLAALTLAPGRSRRSTDLLV